MNKQVMPLREKFRESIGYETLTNMEKLFKDNDAEYIQWLESLVSGYENENNLS